MVGLCSWNDKKPGPENPEFLIKKNYMDDKQKIFEEIMNKTHEDIFKWKLNV